jgi:hypothetical protein
MSFRHSFTVSVSRVDELVGLTNRPARTRHVTAIANIGITKVGRSGDSGRNAILVVMPNNLHCSFCNQPEDQTGPLLAKMEAGPKRHPVRICKDCAKMAIDTIDREVLRRAGEQPRLRVF